MPETVIEVQNLSKKYQLGLLHQSSNSFREYWMQKFKNSFKKDRHKRSIGITQSHNAPDKEIKNASNQNKFFWALKDISFKLKKGEIIGIIGNNGAGKSTLLKILSRITKPSSGRAFINGRVGSLLEVGTGFHPELTGRENIYLNGSILGMKKAEINKNLDKILDFANIEKFLDTPVKRYSSGMYVRLAFAVAAHLKSEILFIDEVLAVGDIAFQRKCLGKIENIASVGRTILYVSHNMSSIRKLCSQVFWLDNGKLIENGSPAEILRRYEEKQLSNGDVNSCNAVRDINKVQDKLFYISQVNIVNDIGEQTNVIPYNRSLTLIVTFKGTPPEENFGIEFKIFKSSGEFACTGTSGMMHGVYFNKDDNQIRIDIGPLTLTSGRYSILLCIMYGDLRSDLWENACTFNIIECFPFALPQEIKTPVCVIPHSFSSLQ